MWMACLVSGFSLVAFMMILTINKTSFVVVGLVFSWSCFYHLAISFLGGCCCIWRHSDKRDFCELVIMTCDGGQIPFVV